MPWTPKDKYMWDFWFARIKSESSNSLHVFYLQADKSNCSFNDVNKDKNSTIGHAVLTDYGWKEHTEIALKAGAPGSWDDLSIWSGSIIEDNSTGLFNMFYTARTRSDKPIWTPSEWQRPQKIGLATSTNLINWQRAQASIKAPVIDNPGSNCLFDGVAWRDPYVLKAGDEYWCLLTTRIPQGKVGFDQVRWDSGGCIVALTSERLDQWDSSQPQLITTADQFYEMEVPQLFWRHEQGGKRYYLLFCTWEKACSQKRRKEQSSRNWQTGTYYLSSEIADENDWQMPRFKGEAQILAPNLYAGKIIGENTITPVFFGFHTSDIAGRFAGGLSDPIAVNFNGDGSISLADHMPYRLSADLL